MKEIVFVLPDGDQVVVEGSSGQSLMEVAQDNMIPGIEGQCGGSAVCATCHVIVDEKWMPAVGTADEMEREMVETCSGVTERSRLSCQIVVDDNHDGLTVHLPQE